MVGTPGRIIDHLNRGTLDISNIEYLIIDEADEMLDMGFIEDVEFIISKPTKRKSTNVFSDYSSKNYLIGKNIWESLR